MKAQISLPSPIQVANCLADEHMFLSALAVTTALPGMKWQNMSAPDLAKKLHDKGLISYETFEHFYNYNGYPIRTTSEDRLELIEKVCDHLENDDKAHPKWAHVIHARTKGLIRQLRKRYPWDQKPIGFQLEQQRLSVYPNLLRRIGDQVRRTIREASKRAISSLLENYAQEKYETRKQFLEEHIQATIVDGIIIVKGSSSQTDYLNTSLLPHQEEFSASDFEIIQQAISHVISRYNPTVLALYFANERQIAQAKRLKTAKQKLYPATCDGSKKRTSAVFREALAVLDAGLPLSTTLKKQVKKRWDDCYDRLLSKSWRGVLRSFAIANGQQDLLHRAKGNARNLNLFVSQLLLGAVVPELKTTRLLFAEIVGLVEEFEDLSFKSGPMSLEESKALQEFLLILGWWNTNLPMWNIPAKDRIHPQALANFRSFYISLIAEQYFPESASGDAFIPLSEFIGDLFDTLIAGRRYYRTNKRTLEPAA